LKAVREGTAAPLPSQDALITRYLGAAPKAAPSPAPRSSKLATNGASEDADSPPASPRAANGHGNGKLEEGEGKGGESFKVAPGGKDPAGQVLRQLVARGNEGWGTEGTEPKNTTKVFRVMAVLTQVGAPEAGGSCARPPRLTRLPPPSAPVASCAVCRLRPRAPATPTTLPTTTTSAPVTHPHTLRAAHAHDPPRPAPATLQSLGAAYLVWRALRTLNPGYFYFYSIPFWCAALGCAALRCAVPSCQGRPALAWGGQAAPAPAARQGASRPSTLLLG
jgi:hypothetical protein